jgi:hypothetical protein
MFFLTCNDCLLWVGAGRAVERCAVIDLFVTFSIKRKSKEDIQTPNKKAQPSLCFRLTSPLFKLHI